MRELSEHRQTGWRWYAVAETTSGEGEHFFVMLDCACCSLPGAMRDALAVRSQARFRNVHADVSGLPDDLDAAQRQEFSHAAGVMLAAFQARDHFAAMSMGVLFRRILPHTHFWLLGEEIAPDHWRARLVKRDFRYDVSSEVEDGNSGLEMLFEPPEFENIHWNRAHGEIKRPNDLEMIH